MRKIQVGDRIAVYEPLGRKTGVVTELHENGFIYYKRDADGVEIGAHPNQCRKLVKKNTLRSRVDEALKYCETYVESMWAAYVVGILLDCEFRDAPQKLKEYFEGKE